ncbi:MAG: hypothetical protein KKB30_13545 [Proteobacteria bacterium]|nr:hypothetical protein [Pseudomonadota bacterium]MBU1717374.1 hypothetical protein [Pseudomonadota bacterium]
MIENLLVATKIGGPLLFKEEGGCSDPAMRSGTRIEELTEEENGIFCKQCRAVITGKENVIRVAGRHLHICYNQVGVIFRVGCFRDAPGCLRHGEPTLENTWFLGYRWRFADCASCGLHLGWQFSGAEDDFFGLIVDKLSG